MSEQVATAQPATEVTGGQTASEPAPVTQEQVNVAKTQDEILSEIWDKHNPPPKAAPQQAAPAEPEPTSDQPEPAAPEPAPSSPAIEPPQSWSADVRAEWAKLPPTVQHYVAQRESEAHKRITQAGNELKTYEPIRQVLDHFRGFYQQGQEAQFFGSLAQANAALHRDPVGTLRALAEYYRVDPAQLAGQQQPASQQGTESVDDLFRDARLDKQVMPVVQQLAGTVEQLQARLAAQDAAAQQSYQASLTEEIAKFSADKPYWNDLYQDVVNETKFLKQSNPNMHPKEILDLAYKRAFNNNDHVRERQRLSDEKTKQDAALKEAAKQAAEAKKRAAMNVRTGAAATVPTHDGAWNDQDKLSALYDRITSGR